MKGRPTYFIRLDQISYLTDGCIENGNRSFVSNSPSTIPYLGDDYSPTFKLRSQCIRSACETRHIPKIRMNPTQIFIAVSIAVLAVIALLVFFLGKRRKESRLTPLAGLAFGFVLAGIIFGDDRLIGYSLMAIGVLLAVIDIFRRSRSK